jgi:hypothetical protein
MHGVAMTEVRCAEQLSIMPYGGGANADIIISIAIDITYADAMHPLSEA